MYNLVNSNFNRTYNPIGPNNALSTIKRLLTSRDTAAQSKACGYLIEIFNRYKKKSAESDRMTEHFLNNDITVFVCEATTNLDFSLFSSVIRTLRLLWRSPRFFVEEHAAHATSAVLRALAHYTGSGPPAAVDVCLHFLCDLFYGISIHKSTPPLSHQSAYSAVQLLACLSSLAPQIRSNPGTILSSALLLETLISYQPDGLYINSSTAKALVPVLSTWMTLVLGALQHTALVGDTRSTGGSECERIAGGLGALYVVICMLGVHAMGLIKRFHHGEQKVDFVQAILADDQDVNVLKQCSTELGSSVLRTVSELVTFTKEYENQLDTEEYGVFLKFLLKFFYDTNKDVLPDFCDMLLTKGYLMMLPQVQITRNNESIRKASTLILGELLKVLSDNYLRVNDAEIEGDCANDIHMGLIELQHSIDQPQSVGLQLQKGQPYSLLIYIYFYCQSSDNPEEATGPLLPFLVEHILKLPESFRPPPYIIKALWLVFAMATISNDTLESLEERVYLEKATERLVSMLHPEPFKYYTHNPALLLWCFTSHRIQTYVKLHIMSEWLKHETSIPAELTTDSTVWELLLNVLIHSNDITVVENCMESLHVCVEGSEDGEKDEFMTLVWSMLPDVLSKALIEGHLAQNISYLLDLATTLLPPKLDPSLCQKTAVLITALFSKNSDDTSNPRSKCHFQYVCLKLCLYLLELANNQNDNRILIQLVNRVGFLPSVLSTTNSPDERVACASLELLSHVVHNFTRKKYQARTFLQMSSSIVLESFQSCRGTERGTSLLQLVYLVLNSGPNTPLALDCSIEDTPDVDTQYTVLRCLLFKIQIMLCRRESEEQLSLGWKTLSSILKHAVVTKNDIKLIESLTTQPWTFTLVLFQASQPPTTEFLTFLQNWLLLVKITSKKSQEESTSKIRRHGLMERTMISLRKNLKGEEEQKDFIQKINIVIKDILRELRISVK